MRSLSAPALSALASGAVALVQLIRMDFSSGPICLNSSTWDLVWQRRYNLLRYSEQFDNGAWVGPVTSTANAGLAPDGSMTADLISGISGIPTFTQSFVAPATALVYSFYTKKGTRPSIQVVLRNSTTSTNFGGASFSYVAGPFGAWIAEALPDGWFRISLAQTTGIGVGDTMVCYAGATGGTVIGPSDTWWLWGAQVEVGETASAYTPTTSVALTELGTTYKGAYGLGQISAINDKPGEVQGITLELHGADASRISLALDDSDVVQGTPITIYTAIIDTSTYQILDAPVEWVGTMDTMSIAEDGQTASIAVTCESRAVDLLRGNSALYTDADQRLISPADGAFKYVLDQIDKPLVWPTREYFYQ